jgi:uncharacterized membrane protein YfcA
MSVTVALSLVVAVVFVSTLLRAAFGFGNALIAMPLLILILDLKTAVPLVALLGLVTAMVMLLREWQELELKDTLVLLAASFGGIPLGLYILKNFPETLVKGILGLVLIGFGSFNLIGVKLPKIKKRWLALPFGFLAGILGGAYNANGPPIVIYGLLRGWSKDTFRTSLQGYFLATSLLITIGHGTTGLWTWGVIRLFLISLPVVILAVVLGEKVISRVADDRFNRGVNLILTLLGMMMFF